MYFLKAESERILLPAASIATVALSAIFSPPTAMDRGRVAGGNSAEFVRRLCIKVTPFQLVAAIQLIIRTGVIVLGICFSLGKPLIAGYRPRKDQQLPYATGPTSQLPNFFVAVRSTLMKSGLQPLKPNGAGHAEICGRLVTWSSWMP